MKIKAVACFVVLACAVVAVSAAGLFAAMRAAAASSFVPGPCPSLPHAIAQLRTARCGTLIVPENRRRPGGKTIRLSVAIIPASSAKKKSDPIIWLAGGPGDDAIP